MDFKIDWKLLLIKWTKIIEIREIFRKIFKDFAITVNCNWRLIFLFRVWYFRLGSRWSCANNWEAPGEKEKNTKCIYKHDKCKKRYR